MVLRDGLRAADPGSHLAVVSSRKSRYVIKGVILERLGGRITSPPIEIRTRAGKKIPATPNIFVGLIN